MQQQTWYDDDELVTRSTPRCCLRRGRCPHRPAGLCVRAALAGCTRCHSCCRGALYMRPAQPPQPPGPGTQRTRFGRIYNPPLRTCPRLPRRGGLYGRPGPGPDSRRGPMVLFAVGARSAMAHPTRRRGRAHLQTLDIGGDLPEHVGGILGRSLAAQVAEGDHAHQAAALHHRQTADLFPA